MTVYDAERLYALLPAVYRIRDQAEGRGALRALVEVLAGQTAVLEESLAQLYDDQFVETAAPWVLPYLGDLLGVAGLPPAPLASRAEVANTLAWRRGKGTAHVLERIARDVTGLPARAVEFFELLAATQHLNHPRPANQAWLSLRGAARLEELGTPFERRDGAAADLAHNVDVRRIRGGRGRYNLPHLGLFLWRLRAYRQTLSPAVPDASDPARRFRFSPLGCDAPLFHPPVTEEDPAALAGPANVPAPIRRRAMHAAPADEYGPDAGIHVERWDGAAWTAVEPDEVAVCDLSAWRGPPPGCRLSIDPVLGRMCFDAAQARPPRATFHYGFGADLGGGEYGRGWAAEVPGPLVRVRRDGAGGAFATLAAGLAALLAAIDADPAGRRGGVLEIADGERYAEPLALDVDDRQVTLRAADGVRPTLLPAGPVSLSGRPEGAVTLDGLLVVGQPVLAWKPVAGGPALGGLRIRHCTLVPGWRLGPDRAPALPGAPSLLVVTEGTRVEVERSVLGPVMAGPDARVAIRDSVVDAGSAVNHAFGGPPPRWGAPLTVENATVLGRVRAGRLELASNTLFLARPGAAGGPPVHARRVQEGCVRFSYVPPGSRTPRRFQCVPRRVEDDPRVRPAPLSTRYGDPAYALLPADAADAVRRGADDEDEMGAFHLLHLSRREAHLRARVEEYLRFGLDAGVFMIP
ncbi:MAG TPA: hypothetical protein VFQ45_03855 [Longimicrobium sp.]|nr:hypothetical protein [Longimicrobium sp.]